MQCFWDNIESFGEAVALISKDGTVSYKKLSQIADNIVENIPERSFVFLVCTNQVASVAGYVAFLRKRIVPVLLSASIDKEFYDNLINIYKPQYIWCPDNFIKESGIHSYDGYKLVSTGNDCPKLNNNLAIMVTTSGSTGSSKFVRLSYQNIQSNTEAIADYLGILSDDKAITTLPMNYVYGLSIINSQLFAGASIIMTEKSIFDSKFWDIFRSVGATTFGAVPYIYQMLDKLKFLSMNLPSLRYITQAGGKFGKDLHLKFAKSMQEKGKKFIVMYGASEATARMSYVPSDMALGKAGSIGVAIPGGRFELIDYNGTVITENGKIGELVYYGQNVMQGYAKNLKDLSKGDEKHGRFETGDLAKRDNDGIYYIVGRKSRFVKVLGNRVNLTEIEELLTVKGYEVACVGKDDCIRIYTTSDDYNDIVDYISIKTGLNPMIFTVLKYPTIPRNQAGKVLYSQL